MHVVRSPATKFYQLDKLQDCAGEHYRLQLNCYRYLLQKYYYVTVSGMWVVRIHPDNEDEPFIDDVQAMPAETEALMSWQRELAFWKEGGIAGDFAELCCLESAS